MTAKNKSSESLIMGRVPPNAADLEEAVLGAILLERENQDVVFDLISSAEIFYKPEHQLIYSAIRTLYDAGGVIDLLTVTEQLRKRGNLEEVGGAYGLTQLTMSVLSSAHVETHAKILLEKYMSRELISIGAQSAHDGYEDTIDVFEQIDTAMERLSKLISGIVRKDPVSLARGLADTMKELKEQSQSKLRYTGVTTGFKELDSKTSGWQKSNVIILAARPSVGKTSFAINLLLNAATAGVPCAFFSLEMNQTEIHKRMLSAISGVECDQVSNPNRLTQDEMYRLDQAKDRLSRLPIFIDDTAGLNHLQLRAKSRKLKKKYNIGLIIIDYLQLMENPEKGINREQQVSQNSRKIKILAKDLDIPMIALSQLNRASETDKGRPIGLSDLRESGAIEQDADIVMFLSYPSAPLVAQFPAFAGKIVLKIAKGRNIGLGDIPLDFNKEIQLWKDVDRGSFNPAEREHQSYEEKLANKRVTEIGRNNFQSTSVIAFPSPPDDMPF